mgnify:CR=1 FL=1
MLHERRQRLNQGKKTRLLAAVVVSSIVLLQAFVLDSVGSCAEPNAVQARRMFVPRNRPELWPPGDWIPVRPQQLDLLMKSMMRSSSKVDRFPFTSATYEASFNVKTAQFEQGTATLLRVRREAEVTPFEPCNLALSNARWVNKDVEQSAILGTGLDNIQQLVAPAAVDQLRFDWQLEGRKRLTGYDFDFNVPRSIVTSFRLFVPAGWKVTSNTGIAQLDTVGQEPHEQRRDRASLVAWRVELGHANVCRIRVQQPNADDKPGKGIGAYRLTSRCQLQSETLEQSFDFRFDSVSPDNNEITIAIPPALIVSSIEDGLGRAFSWRDTGPRSDKWHALRINLTGGGKEDLSRVTIRGRQSVPLPDSGHVQLRIEPPRPDKAVLLGGNTSPFSVVIESPFQVAAYSSDGLRQTATSVDEDRHELGFEQYAARAFLDLQIQNAGRKSLQRLSVREYSLLNAGTTPQELDVLLELTSQARGMFESTWLVPSEWEVTAVVSVGPSGITATSAEDVSWNIKRQPGSFQRLTVDLADGLPVREPLRLRVIGQRADRSRQSEFHVPVILPEAARSVSIAFGVVGCEDPEEVQLISDNYRRHADPGVFTESPWRDLVAVFGEVPQAVWTADNWMSKDQIEKARLHFPDDTFSHGGSSFVQADAIIPTNQQPNDNNGEDHDGEATTTTDEDEKLNQAPATQHKTQLATQRVIVSAEFDSQLSPGSVSRDLHRFTWRFHYSSEASPFRFRLPENSELLAVMWRGQKIAPVRDGTDWVIPLTTISASDELSVDYTLPSQDVYLRETYRCRIPVTDAIVVQFDWKIRLHDQFSVVSFASELTPDNEPRSGNWLSWCFGPLARSASSRVFNPIGLESWIRFLKGRSAAVSNPMASTSTDWKTFSASAAGIPDSLTVHVCDHSRLDALSWFALTLSLLVGVLLRSVAAPHRSQFALVWLSGCVASVALVPGAYAELVGGCALGSILATLVPRSFVRPVRRSKSDVAEVSMASTITRRIVTGSAILAASGLAGSAIAQQNTSELQPTEIDVLVLYDENPFQSNDESSYVCIRSSDLQMLSNSAAIDKDETPEFLMTESDWTIRVTESGRAEIAAAIIVASHRHDGSEIEIPIPARFLAGQAECSVNGRRVGVLPNADGSRLRVPLPHVLQEAMSVGPGETPVPPPIAESVNQWREYRIELGLRPLTQRSQNVSRISLPIPTISNSQVSVSFGQRPQSFSSQSNTARELSADGTADFVLGPTNDLTISWSHTVAETSLVRTQAEQPTVELRSSIDVHPNWMEHRTHAKYTVDGQIVRYIEWKLPELCKVDLNQFRTRNLVDKSLRHESGQVILKCEFDPPMTESFNFEIRWRQTQHASTKDAAVVWATPVVPDQIDVPLTVTSHVAGLTPEAGFQFSPEGQNLTSTSGIAGSDFVEMWPENDRPRIPLMAIKVSAAPVVNAALIPSRPQRTTRVSQVARIRPSGIQWTISAEVDTAVVPAFAHEFLLDQDFRVDSVNVLEDDVDRLSHWDHVNGKLTLHLRSRRSGVQNISITGQQAINTESSPVKLPLLAATVGTNADSTLRVYRSNELQVVIEGPEPLTDDPVFAESDQAPEVFVGRFRIHPEQNAEIRIEPVATTPIAWIVADVTSDEAGECFVSATIHLHAVSQRNLQIQLPEWAATAELAVTPGRNAPDASLKIEIDQRSIDVQLPQPVPQDVEIELTARFRTPPGQSIRLLPPTVGDVEQQHAVLTLSQGMIGWELLPSDAPGDIQLKTLREFAPELAGKTENFVLWQDSTSVSPTASSLILDGLPTLVVHSIRPGVRQSGVANTNILIQTDGREVTLHWPAGLSLISARIDGRVEDIHPSDDGTFRLPFNQAGPVHAVELLWNMERDAQAMKIQRRTMSIPRRIDAGSVQSFVVATPTRRIRLIPTDKSRERTSDDAIKISNKWLGAVNRNSHTSAAFEVAQLIVESLMQADLDSNQQREDRSVADAATNLLFSDQAAGETTDSSGVVIERAGEAHVEFWVVDTQVDRILSSILFAIIAIPAFIILLGLETGDKIAQRPEWCWLALGIIWWLCLKGSGAGFILGTVSVLWIAVAHLIRRRSESIVLSGQ